MTIPPALREALSTLGHSLPTLWHQDTLSRAQRKALLRCLLDKVVLERRTPDTITTRIVWRGGAVSELEVPWGAFGHSDVSRSRCWYRTKT